MADRLLLESGPPDGYQLEDGSGVLSQEGIEAPERVVSTVFLPHILAAWVVTWGAQCTNPVAHEFLVSTYVPSSRAIHPFHQAMVAM